MDSVVSDTVSRVTRSLRKRLTSLDSDNSSRPDTPIQLKLSSIPEISPSTSSARISGHSSTSTSLTPVNTPSKRGINISSVKRDNLEIQTPVRRSTRRRSISINENEVITQLNLKKPSFSALLEENLRSDESSVYERKTRSKSKSPQQIQDIPQIYKSKCKEVDKNSVKTDIRNLEKQSSKFKTQKINETGYSSDVEVSVFGNEFGMIKSKSSNVTAIVLVNDDSSQENIITDKALQEKTQSSIKNEFVKFGEEKIISKEEINCEKNCNQISETQTIVYSVSRKGVNEEKISKCNDYEATSPLTEKEPISFLENIINDKFISDPIENQNMQLFSQSTSSLLTIVDNNKDISNSDLQIDGINTTVNSVSYLQCEKQNHGSSLHQKKLDPVYLKIDEIYEKKEELSADKVNNITSFSNTNEKNVQESKCKTPPRKVDFVSSPESDMNTKNTYPKTPVATMIKKSFVELTSPRIANLFGCEEYEKLSYEEEGKYINGTECTSVEHDKESKMTPKCSFQHEKLLKIVQSSTPINIAESLHEIKSDIREHLDKNEVPLNKKVTNEYIKNSENEKSEKELKWMNPNVKGKTLEGSKLDFVVEQGGKNLEKTLEANEAHLELEKNKNEFIFSHNEKDNNPEEREEHKFEFAEKEHKHKHMFYDEYAVKMDNYKSGDSLNSEERQEIVNNEILVDAEFFGNHTTNDNDYDDVEEEFSKDYLIVSDNEEFEWAANNEEDDQMINLTESWLPSRGKKLTKDQSQETFTSRFSQNGNDKNNSTTSDSITPPFVQNRDNMKTFKQFQIVNKSFTTLNAEGDIHHSTLQSRRNNSFNLNTSNRSNSVLRLCRTPSNESGDGFNDNKIDSGKKLLQKFNQSDRFNKSVQNLNMEIETSIACSKGGIKDNIKKNHEASSDRLKEPEVSLGKLSLSVESDDNKENEHTIKLLQQYKKHGNFKNSEECSEKKLENSCSVAFGSSVNVEETETAVSEEETEGDTIHNTSSSTLTTNDIDKNNIQNVKQISLCLGNPLIRTRRQSLALPTNPDMEICSKTSKESKSKSLGSLKSSRFNPSQSFTDSIELQKRDFCHQGRKRKHLSKSFCGASESFNNSIMDTDVYLHKKRYKSIIKESIVDSSQDSTENMNASKMSTKISSTPREKNDNNETSDYTQRILSRCDEILEAANRAKLKAKLNKKKKRTKTSKEKNNKFTLVSKEENDNGLREISKEIKHKDKTKAATFDAIGAADFIIRKKEQTQNKADKQNGVAPSSVLDTYKESENLDETKGSFIIHKKGRHFSAMPTTIGNFLDMPQTLDEKKNKKTKCINLPTGKVSVEPITPRRRVSSLMFKGIRFRESPITPIAFGFKVEDISLSKDNNKIQVVKNHKKRRHNESFKHKVSSKHQWTQSGLFVEERITKLQRVDRHLTSDLDNRTFKTEGCPKEKKNQNIAWDFKENALMRRDIKRSTRREVLQLEVRHKFGNHY